MDSAFVAVRARVELVNARGTWQFGRGRVECTHVLNGNPLSTLATVRNAPRLDSTS